MTPLDWMERYELRTDRTCHEGWAIIHIDSKGFLGVFSDFGNYAYHWSSFGGEFKTFLTGLDSGYLYSKLTHTQTIYDGEATLRAIKSHILERRRAKGWDPDRARAEWNLLKLHDIEHESSCGFSQWYGETSIESALEFYETCPEPQCLAFCEKVWPRFIEALKAGQCVPLLPTSKAN